MDYRTSSLYLLHEIAQVITAESDQVLKERFGIGFSQLKVLLCLDQIGGISQKEIAIELSQTEASISRQITILYKKNLVALKIAKDNRKNLVFLTPRSLEVIEKSINTLNDIESSLLAGLKSSNVKSLNEILTKIKYSGI